MMLASQFIKEEDIGTANSTWVEVRDPHWNSSILPWDEWTPPNAYMGITFTIERNGYGYGFEGCAQYTCCCCAGNTTYIRLVCSHVISVLFYRACI